MNSNIYRCGWCGNPTDKDGGPLDNESRERVCKIIEKYGDHRTKMTNGYCCPPEDTVMQVSREMVLDAGDPSLEGQWIRW